MNPWNSSRWICRHRAIDDPCPLCTLGTSFVSGLPVLHLCSQADSTILYFTNGLQTSSWFCMRNDFTVPEMAVRAQEHRTPSGGWWCGCCSVLCLGLLTGKGTNHTMTQQPLSHQGYVQGHLESAFKHWVIFTSHLPLSLW